jgi:hypothetical protein
LLIGAAVGFGASVTGSRGPVSGIMCAVFALASIFAGKMFAAQWSIAHYADSEEIRTTLEESLASELNEAAFVEYSQDAADYAELPTGSDLRQFMIDHRYTTASDPADVDPNALAGFELYDVPHLTYINTEQPTFEEWKTGRIDLLVEINKSTLQNNAASFVFSDLGVIDILFAVLGVAAAYSIGSSGMSDEEEDGPAEPPASNEPAPE